MDWFFLGAVALVIAAFVYLYPKIDRNVNIELRYPGLVANLPYILDGVDFLIARYYPAVPYRILIQVVKMLIADYTPDKSINEFELGRILDYVLTSKFSAKALMQKDPENIPDAIKARVDSEVAKLSKLLTF